MAGTAAQPFNAVGSEGNLIFGKALVGRSIVVGRGAFTIFWMSNVTSEPLRLMIFIAFPNQFAVMCHFAKSRVQTPLTRTLSGPSSRSKDNIAWVFPCENPGFDASIIAQTDHNIL